MSKLSTETAEQVIERLGLQPHPYDGWFSPLPQGSTKGEAGIYRLIGVGDFISWHQLPVATMWRHEGGAPLTLSQSSDGMNATAFCLDRSTTGDAISVHPDVWQTAESLGAWSLMACIFAPALAQCDLIEKIRLAPDNWYPGLGQ